MNVKTMQNLIKTIVISLSVGIIGCESPSSNFIEKHLVDASILLECDVISSSKKIDFMAKSDELKEILLTPMPMPNEKYDGMNLIEVLEKITNRKIVFLMRYPLAKDNPKLLGYACLSDGPDMMEYNKLAYWKGNPKGSKSTPTVGLILNDIISWLPKKFKFIDPKFANSQEADLLDTKVFPVTFILFSKTEIMIVTNSYSSADILSMPLEKNANIFESRNK